MGANHDYGRAKTEHSRRHAGNKNYCNKYNIDSFHASLWFFLCSGVGRIINLSQMLEVEMGINLGCANIDMA